jgi:hypothetical protein
MAASLALIDTARFEEWREATAVEYVASRMRSGDSREQAQEASGFNVVARRLYESLGYEPTSIQMMKQL